MRIPKHTAIAGVEGSALSVRRNEEGCSVTRIFIPLKGRCPLAGTLSLTGTLSAYRDIVRLWRIGLFTKPSVFNPESVLLERRF